MKKLFALLLGTIAAIGMTLTVCAQEARRPANDITPPRYSKPVKLSDSELDSIFAPTLKTYSEDEAPDWLKNTNLPTYEYLKASMPESYADAYLRMYRVFYLYGISSSPRLLEYSDEKYLLTDISADISMSEMSDDSLFAPGAQKKYNDFYDISYTVTDENPQFYYAHGTRMIFYSNNRICLGITVPEEYTTSAAVAAQNEAITKTTAEYDNAVSGLDSNYLIEKAVHDKIIIDNKYASDENGNPIDETYSHSIIGILDPRYEGAVCEGYSRALLFFMNRYGVPCFYTAGNTSLGGHAWNTVMLDDGEYHCVDCTWDDNYFVSGGTKIPFLYYKYFNTPYTKFYSSDSRDDTYRKLTVVLPTPSENTNFYDTAYNGSGYLNRPYTSDGKGGRIYPAPDVTYEKARIYAVKTDVDTENTGSSEYTGEFTPYTGYDDIIISGKDFVKLSKNTSNWRLASFYSGERLLVAESNAAVSFLTEYNMQLTFSAYLADGQLDIYIDGQKFKQLGASSYLQQESIPLPCGRHKVTLQYSGTYLQFYNVSAKPRADIDENGSIDILDAIAFSNIKAMSYSSNNTEYLSYDLDDNSIVDDDDLKIILKEAIKAAA